MQTGTGSDRLVESVAFRLANLELTVTARALEPAETASVDSFVVVSGAQLPGSEPASLEDVDSFGVTPVLELQALRARGPAEYAALDLDFLSEVARRLKPSSTEWSPLARIGRAFQAGVAARKILLGELTSHSVPSIHLRDSYFVVLRSAGERPFWTTNRRAFDNAIGDVSSPAPSGVAVGHGFASKAEAESYVIGAKI